jgi:hypothetical protein
VQPTPELRLGRLYADAFSAFWRAPGTLLAGAFVGLVFVVAMQASYRWLYAQDLPLLAALGVEAALNVTMAVALELLWLGLLRMALCALRGRPARLIDLVSPAPLVGRSLVANLVRLPFIIVGCALCLVPGFVVLAATSLAFPLILDKGLGPVAALQAAWAATRGCRIALLLGLTPPFAVYLAAHAGLTFGMLRDDRSVLWLLTLVPVALPALVLTNAAAYDQLWITARPRA